MTTAGSLHLGAVRRTPARCWCTRTTPTASTRSAAARASRSCRSDSAQLGGLPARATFDFRMETEASAAAALYQWAADFCTGAHRLHGRRDQHVVERRSRELLREPGRHRGVVAAAGTGRGPADSPKYSSSRSTSPRSCSRTTSSIRLRTAITDLTLTPRLVARLISDYRPPRFFHDKEFLKLNPHHHWPGTGGRAGLRGEKNADTWIVTNWLNGNPGARFLAGKRVRRHCQFRRGRAWSTRPTSSKRAPRRCVLPARRGRRRAAPVPPTKPAERPDRPAQRGLHRRARPPHRARFRCRSHAHERRRPAGRRAQRREHRRGYAAMARRPPASTVPAA